MALGGEPGQHRVQGCLFALIPFCCGRVRGADRKHGRGDGGRGQGCHFGLDGRDASEEVGAASLFLPRAQPDADWRVSRCLEVGGRSQTLGRAESGPPDKRRKKRTGE